jgi:hypothetical protein
VAVVVLEGELYICYVDEAGDTGILPSATSTVQPAIVLAALMLDQASIKSFTLDFINLKRTFFPHFCGKKHDLDDMRVELKGSVLRKEIRTSNKLRKHHFGFIDGIFKILVAHDAKFTTHVWIKAIGQPMDGTACYTTSVQGMCRHFQEYLVSKNSTGILVADFRSPGLNSDVSHCVFTQKFKHTGDAFDRIIEMPVFGHSENHAGIQITDFLCSTLLFPIATQTYCLPKMGISTHVHAEDARIKARYAPRLRALQYRYYREGLWRGGISVDDKMQGWPSRLMVN